VSQVQLATDSTTCLGAEAAAELGVAIARGSFAFEDQRSIDAEGAWRAAYERIRAEGRLPRAFAPSESTYLETFRGPTAAGQAVLCLVTPFDVSPSFTTASAAMLTVQDGTPGARIKIANPGVSHGGLGALLTTLAGRAAAGADLGALLEALEALEPCSDALVVPAETRWLAQSGRLAFVEEKLGELEDDVPVLRIGTRVTGVARGASHEAALAIAIARVGQRAGTGRLNAVVAHAGALGLAEEAADRVRRRYAVERLIVTDLSMAIGAVVGPGAVAVGVAPADTGGA
jgi:DegV family protein with EDD domain